MNILTNIVVFARNFWFQYLLLLFKFDYKCTIHNLGYRMQVRTIWHYPILVSCSVRRGETWFYKFQIMIYCCYKCFHVIYLFIFAKLQLQHLNWVKLCFNFNSFFDKNLYVYLYACFHSNLCLYHWASKILSKLYWPIFSNICWYHFLF